MLTAYPPEGGAQPVVVFVEKTLDGQEVAHIVRGDRHVRDIDMTPELTPEAEALLRTMPPGVQRTVNDMMQFACAAAEVGVLEMDGPFAVQHVRSMAKDAGHLAGAAS